MSDLYVRGIGIATPGMASWAEARAVLTGQTPYRIAELPPYQPMLLPPNERRRAPAAVRLAFRVAEEAVHKSGLMAANLSTVFTSSDADTAIIDRICSSLAGPARIVSPTDFHNSVHNAAAGYWGIATGAQRASTTLCAYDASAAAGLLEVAAMLHVDGDGVLLVCYDVPPPEPLYAKRPIAQACGIALVLTSEPASQRSPCLHIAYDAAAPTRLDDPELERLRQSNPAARLLPLLQLLASGSAGSVVIEGNGCAALRIDVKL